MARIRGRIRIARPPEQVFDTVADSRNEPAYNPAVTSVELLTPLPIGRGTRFRAHMGRKDVPMLVELTDFNRPSHLGARTTSSLMDTTGSLRFEPDGGGTAMAWDWQVRPRGWLRALGPLFGVVSARTERNIWTGLKRHLET